MTRFKDQCQFKLQKLSQISWCAKLVFGNDVNLHDLFGLAGGILMLMYSIRAKMDSTFGLIEF